MADPFLTLGTAAVKYVGPKLKDLVEKINSSEDRQEISVALGNTVKILTAARKDYAKYVARHTTKEPSESYKEWNRRVEKIEVEVKELLDKYSRKKPLVVPNFVDKCSKSIKKMKKAGEDIRMVLEWLDQLKDRLFSDPALESVEKNDNAPEIIQFETLQGPLVQILDLLKIEEVNVIGICGPLGIGKTTIMWNLNNHEVAKTFDIVICLKVSTERSKENLSRDHMQQDIVRRLKIHEMKGNTNADEVAKQISTALRGKKYLLLLDDVKKKFEVSELGIPRCSNGSKIVLTTRLRHVCYSMVDRVIKVTYLCNDEPWKMFQKVLNNPKLIDHPTIGPLAWRLCNECSGLPLLIQKVANTFKLKNDELIWFEGLSSWRKWPEKGRDGIWEMYELLKFCYDDLDDDHQKKCFLYSALYPEDKEIEIDYLLECWAAEGFLGQCCNATMETLMVGSSVLNHLEHVALFDKRNTRNQVTMHKFIRQVALHISANHSELKYLVETSRGLEEAPAVNEWIEKNSISLSDNKLKGLPDSPQCKMVSTLFLQGNSTLESITASFFEHMQKLLVLDLSHTGIESLPSSSEILKLLKVLYLNNCARLVELSFQTMELEHLETLDIRESGVNIIPADIEKLTCLKRLLVSLKCGNKNANQNVQSSYNKISELSRLEELVIDVKSHEQWSEEVVENIIKQVAKLQKIRILKVCISNEVVVMIKVMPKPLYICVPKAALSRSFMEGRSADEFQVSIGCKYLENPKIPDFQRYKCYVKYCNGAGSNFPIPESFGKVDALELFNHEEIKQLSKFGTAGMNNIKTCHIEGCGKIETIMDTIDSAILPNLEHLYMKNLPMLKSMWNGTVIPGRPVVSLTKLTTLVLTRCKMLVKIFPLGVIQQLCEIQHLEIEDCEVIEEIITISDTVEEPPPILPNLKKLVLLDLPKLERICAIKSLEWRSLEELTISKCPALKKLPFNKDSAPNLIFIRAEQHWWKNVKLHNVKAKKHFKKFYTNSS